MNTQQNGNEMSQFYSKCMLTLPGETKVTKTTHQH